MAWDDIEEYEKFLEEEGLTEEEYPYQKYIRDGGDDEKYEYYLRGD